MTDYDIHLDDKFGSLALIDIEGGDTAVRDPHQGCRAPKRVKHRTRAPVQTAILMVEAAGVQPTGD